MLTDLLNLFYPNNCCACNRILVRSEVSICTFCEYGLPRSGSIHNNQILNSLLWRTGKMNRANSTFLFDRKGKMQPIIHAIKYRGDKALAIEMGKLMAINSRVLYKDVDILVPVPMHPKKLKVRGYNQAYLIAKGISKITNIPICESLLVKSKYTNSQTDMSREERAVNMLSSFNLNKEVNIENKIIGLVDDVFTTGATIGACGKLIADVKGTQLNAYLLAYTVI